MAALFIAAVYAYSFWEEPARLEERPPLCALRSLAGIPCPFCGMSRAFASISHGDYRGAVRLHPLAPLAYIGGLFLLAAIGGGLAGLKRLNLGLIPSPLKVLVAAAVIALVYWAIVLAALASSGGLGAAFRSSPLGALFR
jgi:hypothetical protein